MGRCRFIGHKWNEWRTDIGSDGFWASCRVCSRCGLAQVNTDTQPLKFCNTGCGTAKCVKAPPKTKLTKQGSSDDRN